MCPSTGSAWLGHRRLAIVDLSPAGAQPMVDPVGGRALVFNGEIYNAPTLRAELEQSGAVFASRSDTEVLLHGYAAWGIHSLLDRLRGMFAFALWDAAHRTLVAAVDHAGMKPLFYSEHAGTLFIASTADALRPLLPEAPRPDGISLAHVLTNGCIPAPRTAWTGVSKLPAGSALAWKPGAASANIWRHWSPPSEAATGPQPRFEEVWEPVVAEHLLGDVPVALLLSSGLDSAAVALALTRAGARPASITLSLQGADDEAPAAAATAGHLKLPHASRQVDASDIPALLHTVSAQFDEPQSYGALLTMSAVCPVAREHAKVVLSGDGGDEAFAGYLWHRNAPGLQAHRPTTEERRTLESSIERADGNPSDRTAALNQLAAVSPLHAYAQSVHPLFHPAEAAALLGVGFDDDEYLAPFREASRPGLPWPRRAQAIDLATFCAGSILPKVDRASMAVGLEVRAPFLDRRVLEWALSRPVTADEREHPGIKHEVRRYLAGHVPPAVLTRPKQGFSLRTDWSPAEPAVRRLIAESRLVREGLLRADWAAFARPDAPFAQRRVFALAQIAAWYERRATP